MKKLILICIIAFHIVTINVAQINDSSSYNYSDVLGKPLPKIELTSLSGTTWTNEDLKGKVVLLTFWSMECGISLNIIPYLNDLNDKYNKEEVLILSVAPQMQRDLKKFNSRIISKYSLTRKLLIKEQIEFEIIPLNIKNYQGDINDNTKSSEFLEQMNFDHKYPVTFIIDKNGIIRYYFDGLKVDEKLNFIDNYEDEIEELKNKSS